MTQLCPSDFESSDLAQGFFFIWSQFVPGAARGTPNNTVKLPWLLWPVYVSVRKSMIFVCCRYGMPGTLARGGDGDGD